MKVWAPALLLFLSMSAARAADMGRQTALLAGDDDRSVLEPFFSPAQLDALDAREKTVLADAARDPAWPKKAAFFLERLHDPSISDWSLLSDRHKGAVLREWARCRLDALDAARQVRLSARPTQEQARQIRLLSAAGFLTAADTAPLSELKTASGAALLAATPADWEGAPETQREAAGKPFRESAGDGLLLGGKGQAPEAWVASADFEGPERSYAAARTLVLDPDGFAKTRPELFAAADGQDAARGLLRQRLGRLFASADALRARHRLIIESGPLPREGPALGDVARVSLLVPGGDEKSWTLVVRLADGFLSEDPALLAPVWVHELQHVYDLKRRVERFGPGAAARLGDFSEQEERAFAAQCEVEQAYAAPLKEAYERNKTARAWLIFTSSRKLLETAALKDDDPEGFRAELKDMAARELRARGAAGGGWNDLAGLEKTAAEQAAQLSRRAAGASSFERLALQRDLARTRAVLREIGEEKRRGLSL